MKLAFLDVRRAYFNAKARRIDYTGLPQEDYEEGVCGKFGKAMYDARNATQNWEVERADHMINARLSRGKASLCVFWILLAQRRFTEKVSPA